MISFDLSEEQRMIRDTIVAFAAEEIRPEARNADESGDISPALIAKTWELCLVRGAIPEQFGGCGDDRSAVTGVIAAEELAYGDLSIAIHVLAPRLIVFPVLEFGTEQQRARVTGRSPTPSISTGELARRVLACGGRAMCACRRGSMC